MYFETVLCNLYSHVIKNKSNTLLVYYGVIVAFKAKRPIK